jgi:hypothetical protein
MTTILLDNPSQNSVVFFPFLSVSNDKHTLACTSLCQLANLRSQPAVPFISLPFHLPCRFFFTFSARFIQTDDLCGVRMEPDGFAMCVFTIKFMPFLRFCVA